ncbi:ribosome-recycling factor-like [Macrosteles quadrilineatus]|uniref:ribosome-recycling factor-like n=1 Tax=Macrosteles quadrilineatus TaxID=74068 RepID=UPI0023E2EB13|nr:ribosome-recycling factor-like [Macrosteles quadrilineatus]
MASEEDPREAVLEEAEKKMKSALEVFDSNLKSIRTGRAHPDILDPISVKVYDGKKMGIKELATITAPETRLLTLTVWDEQNVDAIVKALRECNFHFNPQVDGNLIRISLPHLTEETRKTLSKQAKEYTEDCKVALRNIRKKCSDDLKGLQKQKKISEDDAKHFMNKQVHKLLERMIVEAERKLDEKNKDLLTV